MTPFFSIIIPVYNVAPYLRECLDSVLAQTFGDWEAICIDDGSTDDSGIILDEYAERDKRFKVVHQANAGVSEARNKGLDLARGTWGVFLDGDDMFSQNGLGEIASCANKFIKADLIFFELSRSLADYGDIRGESFLFILSAENSISLQREAWRIAYKRDLIERNQTGRPLRFQPFISTEDVLFAVSAESLSQQIAVSPAIVYYYRVRSGSVENRPPTLRYVHDWLIANRLVLDKLDEIRGFHSLKQCTLFKWMKPYLFYTHRFCIFKVKDCAASQEVCHYVELLRRMDKMCAYGLYEKTVIAILSIFPSIVIARCLVYYISRLRTFLGVRRFIRWFKYG